MKTASWTQKAAPLAVLAMVVGAAIHVRDMTHDKWRKKQATTAGDDETTDDFEATNNDFEATDDGSNADDESSADDDSSSSSTNDSSSNSSPENYSDLNMNLATPTQYDRPLIQIRPRTTAPATSVPKSFKILPRKKEAKKPVSNHAVIAKKR